MTMEGDHTGKPPSPPPLSDPVKMAVFMTIAEVLKPLIDKWAKEIRRSTPSSAGLIDAQNDVQSIIDGAAARVEMMGGSAEVTSVEAPKNVVVNVINCTAHEIEIARSAIAGQMDIIVRVKDDGLRR